MNVRRRIGRWNVGLVLLVVCLAACECSVWAEDDSLERADAAVQAERAAKEALRIKAAEAETKRLDDEIRRAQAQLAEVKKWARTQFELGERDVIDKPKLLSPLLRRWQEQREKEIYVLLQFRDKSSGAVESGRALNVLLERIGAAAHENCQMRRLNSKLAAPLYEPTSTEKIAEDVYRRLSWRENNLGAKASGRFNQAPIDVDWPQALRGEQWESHRATVEASRAAVFKDLESGAGVQPKNDDRLRRAIADFNAAFSQEKQRWSQTTKPGEGNWAQEYRQLCVGRKHLDKLVASVYQVVEATSLLDVGPKERFEGGNIEELLSYMHRHNLRFATAAKGTDRSAYYKVFDLMVRYYLDLKAVARAEQQLEQEIAALKKNRQEAVDVALGKSLSAADQTALKIEEMKFLRALLKDD